MNGWRMWSEWGRILERRLIGGRNVLGYKTDRTFTMSANKFSGIDLSAKNKNLLTGAAAMAENMFTNGYGEAEKRTGLKSVYCAESGKKVHGIYKYSYGDGGENFYILHESESLYILKNENGKFEKDKLLYSSIADCESKGFVFGGALYIMCDGYYKIAYEEAFCGLGVCRICNFHEDEDSVQVIVSEREKEKLDGIYSNVINEEIRYAKIKFKEDDYYFQYSDTSVDKLYIAPPGYIDSVRVVKVVMGTREVEEFHYSVGEDKKGMYVMLKRKNVYIEKKYTCSPEITVEIGGFVYAPLIIASREAIGINSSDEICEEHKEREHFTGEYVQDLNSACGLRRVNFYVDFSNFSQASKLRFYLNEKDTDGKVLFIRAAGKLIHSYAVQEDLDDRKYVADSFYDCYVELDKSFLKELTGTAECVVEIEYISKKESEIDGCDVFGFYGGANDTRVFVSGNAKNPARDFESGSFDASYFPELSYTTVGDDYSKILAYGRFFSYQLIFKDKNGQSAMYFRHMGEDGVYEVKKGELLRCAVSKNAVANVNSHLFVLSEDGIFSVESTAIEGQSKSVLRSAAVEELLKKEDCESLRLVAWGGKLLVLAKKRMYVLDIEGGYRWYVYTFNKPIDSVCDAGDLDFICENCVCVFKSEEDENAYKDEYGEGEEYNVCAYWKTNNVCFTPFAPRSVISAYCVTGDEAFRSSVSILYDADDFKDRLAIYKKADVFTFENFDFSRVSFWSAMKGRSVMTHLRAKRVYRFSLTLKNDEAEAFKICEVGFLYR